jgi:hypothetical protein
MSDDAMSPTDLAVRELERAGITSAPGALSTAWADSMGVDVFASFEAAMRRDGGAIARGPHRWYVEMHPEELRGYLELVTHPWVTSVAEAVLGPEYELVELGFDIPFPGAELQPWHRDFPSPPETWRERRLTSLAFNLTAVDTVPEMGGFEIAPGTHWEDGREFEHGMFPPRSRWAAYEAVATRRHPQRGDVSARSALTIHRGTPNTSRQARPVLVLGVDAPGAGHAALHDQMVTRGFHASLPDSVRRHLSARVVDELVPIVQRHAIDGLREGARP